MHYRQQRRDPHHPHGLGLALASAWALATAFAMAAPAAAQTTSLPTVDVVQELTLDATDYAFAWPDTVDAGWTRITVVNDGQDIHHAQLVRLAEGVTEEDVAAATAVLEEDPAALFALITLEGGAGIIAPGVRQDVVLDLEPGTYVWLCGIPAADGEPHFMKGMIRSFEVVAADGATTPVTLEADRAVSMQDFAFGIGETVPAGPQLWAVSNDGSQPHEMLLAKLEPGASALDYAERAFDPTAAGPPPGFPMGGLQAIAPGTSAWLGLDLVPGTYVAICFVPDPESGQPHLALGMISEFTVQA
jgi:hypothetical protein